MKKFIAVLLSSIMVISLVACGGGTTTKYVCESCSLLGFESSWEELGGGECYVELGTDGSFTFVFNGEKATGSYTQNGENLTLGIDGTDCAATLSGDKLVLSYSYSDPDFGDIDYTLNFVKE